MSERSFFALTYPEAQGLFGELGLPRFVAEQVFQWIYRKGRPAADDWRNVARASRKILAEHLDFTLPRLESALDGRTEAGKAVLSLADGQRVESVLLREKDHYTFCLSSQVGCPLGCRFCRTGQMGWRRDLTTAEIVGQAVRLKEALPPTYQGRINVVFMGMGEPLLNYEAVKGALGVLMDPAGFAISPRHITVSTAGITPGLARLETDFPRLRLAVSLNAPDASLRSELMPVTRAYPLPALLHALASRRRAHPVTFEYVLLGGVNDSPGHSRRLARLVGRIPCKINLIPFNPVPNVPYAAPPEARVAAFAEELVAAGLTAVIRWSKGRTHGAACGQLAGESARAGGGVCNAGGDIV
ncbi:MAG TPA: 23S rRNA (adenine(2503)-C(2))-methyltransferase RlmN [Candidatus Aminicenantes bacterium]|nr:23S rRNA (adenine(2503)-C(2))-methyltransferase RlmN [Candidatus Aminicenantes bacterium]